MDVIAGNVASEGWRVDFADGQLPHASRHFVSNSPALTFWTKAAHSSDENETGVRPGFFESRSMKWPETCATSTHAPVLQ